LTDSNGRLKKSLE
jgi:hypothetical protein